MKIVLPDKVQKIIEQLNASGFEAYAVGGCVRDCCLGRIPNDWDITTAASPIQVKQIFPKTFDTGIEHGTITVLLDGEGFEVTTYRIDGEYEDGRHPKQVSFTPSLTEDLKRRDFTINAMAYNEREGLVDLFGGLEDLEAGVLRCVGNPRERFLEDALRMMRAVRFCAQLGFEMEAETARAIRELAPTLSRISAERVQAELVKLLVSPHPEYLRNAWELGITGVILPEFDALMCQPQNNGHHIFSVGEHTLETLCRIREEKVLRLTMLLHDMGKPACAWVDEKGVYHYSGHAGKSAGLAKDILKRLKFDNDTSRKVVKLVGEHSLYPEATAKGVRFGIYQVGEELFPLFLEVKQADVLGQNPKVHEKKLAYLGQLWQLYQEILERGDCLSLRQLAVTGRDLMELGIPGGKELGALLHQLLLEVLEEPEKNQREILLHRSMELQGKSNGI